MPAPRKTTLQIVLEAVNRTVAPFAVIKRSLASLQRAGVAAFAAIGGAIKRMGTTLASLAGPLAAIQAIRVGTEFETGVAKIGTLGEEARGNLELFRVELERIAVMSGTPLDDLTDALFNMISAGVDPSISAIKTLDEANRLAVAGSASLSSSTLALTKVMNAYGMSADDAREISEVLFATQVIGQTTVDEVAQNFSKFTAIGKSVGVSLEELATAFGDITKDAANSEEAATSLRSALTVLQKPSSDLEKVMKNLGLSLENLFDDGRNLGEVFSAIKKESERIGVPLAKVVGNVRAFTAASTLASDEGSRFTTALDNFREATTQLDASLELLDGTTERTLSKFREFIKVLAARVATPWMREINEHLVVTSGHLQEAKIRAEIFGLEVVKWVKQAQPFMDFLSLAIESLSVAVRSAYGFGKILGQIAILIANTLMNSSEVFKTLVSAGQSAFDHFATSFKYLGKILEAMLWNLAGAIQKTLLFPFQMLLKLVQQLYKSLRVLAWEITHLFSDLEMPEERGRLGFLDSASAQLDTWAAKFDNKMGDVGSAFDEFMHHTALVGDKSSHHWDQVTAAVGRLWGAVKEGKAFLTLDQTFREEKRTLLSGLVEVNDLRIKLFDSIAKMSSGTLSRDEESRIRVLQTELEDLINKASEGADSSETLWKKMQSGINGYRKALQAGFSDQETFNTLILGMKPLEPKVLGGFSSQFAESAQQLKASIAAIGQSINEAFGEAKAKQVMNVWASVGSLIGKVFKTPPIDKAKQAMEQWTLSVEELRGAIIQTAQNALANFFDQVVAGTANAGDAWKAMLRAMLSAINKFMADRIVLQFMQGLGFDIPVVSAGGSVATAAEGAVFQGGFRPYQEFASGGIVTRPTLGLIGEGKQNEAVVPLPDGRSIPVAMSGGGSDSFSITIQAVDAASVKSLLLSDAGQRSIVAAFQNARSTRRGFSR